ncbi:MAG: ParB N-terminal domain-containing protein [Candidatus Aenigmarchaeota archaeon]|nr:ParB N-terminal domain-containing protein [Candidatus Aenigmarchaeota archaeon]
MFADLVDIPIDSLILAHPEVRKNKVGRYVMSFVSQKNIEPVSVTKCVTNGNYYLTDGHHRVVAAYFLGNRHIRAQTLPCTYDVPECNGKCSEGDGAYSIQNIVLVG